MRTTCNPLIAATSTASNFNTNAYWLDQVYVYAIQWVITGVAATGTVKLQGSCDVGTVGPVNPTSGSGVVNWTDITGASTSVTAGVPASGLFNADGVGYKWVRLVWTGSGAGTLAANINTKGS